MRSFSKLKEHLMNGFSLRFLNFNSNFSKKIKKILQKTKNFIKKKIKKYNKKSII